MNPEEFRGFRRSFNCDCSITPAIPTEPPESAVARMIAGLEMLLREAAEDES